MPADKKKKVCYNCKWYLVLDDIEITDCITEKDMPKKDFDQYFETNKVCPYFKEG